MRQGQQQNRRGRGRGGRKPQNPLARSYESNGPDVKIRGTAAHVAEKYMTLARDALSSGDPVSAESYLQHAEHYNRIIMAAQAQVAPPPQAGDQVNGGTRARPNPNSESGDDQAPEMETAEATGDAGSTHPAERGRGRQGRNGAEGVHDANGAEPAEAQADDEVEKAPDQVS